MNLEAVTPFIAVAKSLLPELSIIILSWIAYGYVVFWAGFVSDDHQGLVEYNGVLQSFEYGTISRWLRYHICGGNFPSAEKFPDGTPVPLGKNAWRHHLLILTVFQIGAILAFEFLRQVIGGKLALLAVLLFVVHPVSVQAVAWCSALGYPLSLLWIGAMLNLILFWKGHNTPGWTIICTIAFVTFQFLGIHAQVFPMMIWAILLLLGYWQWALLGFLISASMMLDIVKQTIDFRTNEFKKQNMGNSTFVNPRKVIVALKTLAYYVYLAVWPNKMGLYHKFGFHFGPDLERADWRSTAGLAILVASTIWFCMTPVLAIKLGLLWFGVFLFIFLNWVTIQQFITERYLFVPSLGFCLIVAYFTQSQPLIYGLIFGAFICRTWLHLPTYDNEMRFYQSNTWNFPDSEVAYGNLGVTQTRVGMNSSAMDTWLMATRINPDYDVPWVNIFFTYQGQASMSLNQGRYDDCLIQLRTGLPYLQKALACKICHFPDEWKKTQTKLLETLANPTNMLLEEKNRLLKLLNEDLPKLKNEAKTPERLVDVDISINDAKLQLNRLDEYLARTNAR